MALAQRVNAGGSGWSKKNETRSLHPNHGRSMRLPWKGVRRRRAFQGLVVTILIYFFIHNIPTDVPSVGRRYNANFGSMASGHSKSHLNIHPGGIQGKNDQITYESYDEVIRFSNLSTTLRLSMARPRHDAVVFAATSHTSVQKMIPLICDMAQFNRSTIHVALMGKQDVSVHEIMTMNSIPPSSCNVMWHDATPDEVAKFSPARLRESIKTVLPYINSAIQPRIILVDDVSDSDHQLMTILRDTANTLRLPLLTLPANAMDSMDWVAALDSQSLRQLSDVRVEIVVQPYSESAGSLIRLLRSIQRAHYNGLSLPRLTIELPSQIDSFITSYLSGFRWPPGSSAADNQLVIRRRIDLNQITAAQASLRMVESFYPSSPSNSHILVLSPDVELAPDYMHYLMFTLLEYKYAEASAEWSNHLMGISLELPSSKLDGNIPFLDPALQMSSSFVRYQSPNSNAALYFGDRWVEFHSFLSKRMAADPHLSQDEAGGGVAVSQQYPQWLAQASELMVAQGYTMLFPAFAHNDKTKMVVVHTDLHHTPEEFSQPIPEEQPMRFRDDYVKLIVTEGVLSSASDNSKARADTAIDRTARSILTLFGIQLSKHGQSTLPELATLPSFSPAGELWDREQTVQASLDFADKFALRVGGCKSLDVRDKSKIGTVDYLFCEPD